MTRPFYSLYSYAEELKKVLSSIDENVLNQIKNVIFHNKGTIYVCGNGGSASIAEHLTCDCMKGVALESEDEQWLNIVSLSSNFPLISAIANDISYSHVFSKQLQWHGCGNNDILIVISSSGNSLNIINAINKAKERKTKTIAIVGFDGGICKKLADHVIHINSDNYGIVEDASQSIMHFLSQAMRREISNKNPEDIKY